MSFASRKWLWMLPLLLAASVYGVGRATRKRAAPAPPTTSATPFTLVTRDGLFTFRAGQHALSIESLDRKSRYSATLYVKREADSYPLIANAYATTGHANSVELTAEVPADAQHPAAWTLQVGARLANANSQIQFILKDPTQWRGGALRAAFASKDVKVFAPGYGAIADVGEVSAEFGVLDDDRAPLTVMSQRATQIRIEEANDPEESMTLVMDGTAIADDDATPEAGMLSLFIHRDSSSAFSEAFAQRGATELVHGKVLGAVGRVNVGARTAAGIPLADVRVDSKDTFTLAIPVEATLWHASLDSAQSSTPVVYVPGTREPLVLDISPGGTLDVTVGDPDTQKALTARVIVRGRNGTLDPNFGPDYRASGAGPVVDSLRGELSTPIPAGDYRVYATKGTEYSIDFADVQIRPARKSHVALQLRHVVATPGLVGCDLHVHARPSFDSPVTPEDRVMSLIAAGIDFAVPTEHNIIGDYRPALQAMGLRAELAAVPGIEVTTFGPKFGHFGVFPLDPNGEVPPFFKSSPAKLFAAVRDVRPSPFLQINHPRMTKYQIGYFETLRVNTQTGSSKDNQARFDFDAIEVMNGLETGDPKIAERNLVDYFNLLNLKQVRYVATGSSDSHRILYGWAGYPRTYVRVAERDAGDDTAPVNPDAVIAGLKRGNVMVSGGPIIHASVDGAQPGDEVHLRGNAIGIDISVAAATWVDVAHLDVVVNGRVAVHREIAKVPSRIGPEPGTLVEAQARTQRFTERIEVARRDSDRWVMVVVRGDRKLDDVLPNTPMVPMAFTNPIWLAR
jgi:hypothetical protein